MSYSEENGQVVLRMSREDYEELDSCIKLVQVFEHKILSGEVIPHPPMPTGAGELRDRLNEGNPNYTPYGIGEKS